MKYIPQFSVSMFIVGMLVLLASCYTISPKAKYSIRLAEVERPADAKTRYGEQLIETRTAEGDSLKYWFEDSLVSILWYPTNQRVYFLLENKASHSIKIIWDESAFLMPTGDSRRIVHSGVKYSEVTASQPPSVIPKGGMFQDFVVTSDQDYYSAYGWTEKPIHPDEPEMAVKQDLRGKSFSILLPLQIEGVTNEYLFSFSIDNVILPVPPPPPGYDR